ncbi:MAG: Holliday junction branch migration protein RuvA [Patescibacteria group bacterium]
MISIIKGKVVTSSGSKLVVLTSGGVGYEIMVSATSAKNWAVGAEIQILTYLAVREGSLDLYGFVNESEKELFEKFLLVGGIGPKTALHLLSLGSVQEISSAIGRGDLAYLTNVSGIGKKTAERILVELKNKVGGGQTGLAEFEGALGDVIEGLAALGYSLVEAREAVKNLDIKGKSSEQLLKEALQRIK